MYFYVIKILVFPWRFAKYVEIIIQVCWRERKKKTAVVEDKHFHYFSVLHFKENPGEGEQVLSVVFHLLRHFSFLGVGKQPILSINHFLPSLWHFLQPVVFMLAPFFFSSTFKHFKILLLLDLKICLYQLFMLFMKLNFKVFWNSVFFLILAFLFSLFILLK